MQRLKQLCRQFLALRPRTRLTVTLCAAAITLCLALPPAVFAVWDRVLLAAPQLRADAGQTAPLADAARQNETACLLYGCARLLGVDVSRGAADSGQWQPLALAGGDLADLRARCAAVVEQAAALGLLDDADAARLQAALAGDAFALAAWAGPAGMTACRLAPCETPPAVELPATPETAAPETAAPETPDDLTLDLTLTSSGRAVAFAWHDNTRAGDFAETDGLLAPALALLGVDDFADWQTVDWGGRLPHAGETAYSPTAQLYVSVNANGGLTVAAASMTPEEFAALLA